MYALPIRSPRIMPIALLGVKARALKYFPRQRAKIDIDMGEIYGVLLCLGEIAVVPS
jgi:hypothetical protein